MPQMNPMNWILIFILNFLNYWMIISLIYFSKNIIKKNKLNFYSNNMIYMFSIKKW